MWKIAFWKGAAERMIRSAAASLLSLYSLDVFVDVFQLDWKQAASAALGAALFSLLFSLATNASGVGPVGSPSAVYDRPRDYGIAVPVDPDQPRFR